MPLPRALVRLAARAQRHVPEPAWPALLAVRSAVGSGPLVAPPTARRAVVLAPHPDDESIGCGGTLALLADAGAEVTVAFVTDGEATVGATASAVETAARRRAEAEVAGAVLGVATRFCGLPDGAVASRLDELVGVVAALAAELAPEVVFAPWPLDGHPDHRAVARALARAAVTLPAGAEVWGYETWTPLEPTRVVDVTAVVDRKREAIAAHVTAHQAFDVGAMLGLNRYRSVHGLLGRGFAEAFFAVPAGRWATVVAELDGLEG
ncbi:MAG: PIG-L family deacetylase [Acidimicrobiales bacterium]|nr:PIG-L family deacetylase [Acidimicrobiales bacterium]